MMAVHEALHHHQVGTAHTLAPIHELISRMRAMAESNIVPARFVCEDDNTKPTTQTQRQKLNLAT